MMKNKVKLKKYLLFLAIFIIITFGIILMIHQKEYQSLIKNYNQKIASMISLVKEKYPAINENELLEILNSQEKNNTILDKYYIDLAKESVILENKAIYQKFIIINVCIYLFVIAFLLFIFNLYNKSQDKELKKIIKYLEKISNKDYSLEINELSEDELSILKNELYKITIMLKETAENSQKDKLELKKSLEDISHQLKTPLTSILIMLDNLEDNELDGHLREEFLRDIKREVNNINFLVQNLLKLSKFDVNAINFTKNKFKISDLLNDCIKNVATLSELKNITIKLVLKKNFIVNLDYHWNREAITNILKNCIEYSENNGQIILNVEDNNAYTKITIEDFGKGISKEDLPHIFERFYKGKLSSSDSVGIGLSLAKTIIEKDNGNINVFSNNNGTIFEIKYYKI